MRLIKNFRFGFLILALVLGMTACKNQLIPIEQASTIPADKAGISFAISLPEDSAARTIFPTVDFSKYTYTVKGKKGTGTETTYLTKVASTKLSEANAIILEPGSWTFTITAYNGDSEILSGSTTAPLSKGANTISVTMKAVAGGTGSAEITLQFPSDKGVTKVTAGIYGELPITKDTGDELTITEGTPNSVKFTANDINSAAEKYVKFFLYNASGSCVGEYTESLYIVAGLTTKKTVTADKINETIVIDGAKIAATEDGWPIWTYSLSEYSGSVTIEFSAEVAVENTNNEAEILYWKVLQDGYQTIASHRFEPGTTNWTTITGTENIVLEENKALYIPKPSTDKLKIYIKNVSVTVTEYIDLSDAEKTILGSNPPTDWQLWNYSLNDYKDKTVSIIFSMDVAVENGNEDSVNLLWQTNTDDYPTHASHNFAAGTTGWTKISGKIEDLEIKGNYKSLYINLPTGADKLTVYLKNIEVAVIPTDDVETIDGSKVAEDAWTFKAYDLGNKYNNKTVKITFSVNMKVENAGDEVDLVWRVNSGGKYPELVSYKFESGDSGWVTVKGTKEVELGNGGSIYLDTNGITKKNLTIYLINATITIIDPESSWLEAPKLKDAYSTIFDHIGIALELNELSDAEVRQGISRHANSISMGNEMKPQFILLDYGASVQTTGTFTASNGKTIYVPTLKGLDDYVGASLNYAKAMGVQMRGHVLTWHSQTFDWFFCKNYNTAQGLLTDKDEMTARHEWYIKTVLEYVANWEATNGYAGSQTESASGKKHLIYTWDVVNEAVADDASSTNYYRGDTNDTKNPATIGAGCNSNGDSRWWQIYKSNEFIINAFRFANKYAPKDVTLCYNDYNEYMGEKHNGDIKLLQAVLAHKNDSTLPTRLDAMAMQSHLENWTGIGTYENAVKDFLNLGIDVQVTELDFKWNDSKKNNSNEWKSLESLYDSYFKLFQRYAKSNRGTNGITSVTIWGINDENTWLNKPGETYYPLLFTKQNGSYNTKGSFYSVLDAAGKTN